MTATKLYFPAGSKGSLAALRYYYQAGIQFAKYKYAWYHQARDFCTSVARLTGLEWKIVAGVTAILSPQLSWDVNMLAAEKMCTEFAAGRDQPVLPGFKFNRNKAWKLLETGDLTLVTGRKVLPFYRCICYFDAPQPKGVDPDLPIDRVLIKAHRNCKTPGAVDFPKSVHQECIRDICTLADYYGVSAKLAHETIWQGYQYLVKGK